MKANKNDLHESGRPLTQEDFINKIKTDNEFAKKWGELGPIYGKQWRSWKRYRKVEDVEHKETIHIIDYVDQITNLINELKTNPDSRRLLVSAWNISDLPNMVLPPCHYGFQVYTRELSLVERYELMKKLDNWISVHYKEPKTMEYMDKHNIPTRAISLIWNQRSVDTPLGLPFNIASYGLLLEIIAKEVNMVPDELIGNLGDTHIYLNQIEGIKEQIGRGLTDEERYNIWFNNNYETGMERYFDPNNLPDYDNAYYNPTPKRTREPFELPTLKIEDEVKWKEGDCLPSYSPNDFTLENYQSHPTIKLPLSN